MRPFEKYLRLLLDLHRAMGNGDEVKADNLRDEMDKSYYQMSKDEITLVDKVLIALDGNDDEAKP